MKEDMTATCKLNNGVEIPCVGLGTLRSDNLYDAIRYAIDIGYRHIDTAEFYKNEDVVGQAVKDSGIPREQLFITTKVWPLYLNEAEAQIQASLKRLKMDYADLYLIHWPGVDIDARHKAWDVINEYQQKGAIRACGVSNFSADHLEELIAYSGAVPADDQVELHPYNAQKETRAYCEGKGIAVTAWGPLFHGHLSEVPLMAELGSKYGKTPGQVTLRWHLQKGNIIIPKSSTKERIYENIQLFDFALSDEDMQRIDALDGTASYAMDNHTFDGDLEKLAAHRKKQEGK
ncbi:MAG: aldo/keto reductase [Christensenellaceae bacterium]|jgi:diketogulonate reductase-like aldo/keto reductase